MNREYHRREGGATRAGVWGRGEYRVREIRGEVREGGKSIQREREKIEGLKKRRRGKKGP